MISIWCFEIKAEIRVCVGSQKLYVCSLAELYISFPNIFYHFSNLLLLVWAASLLWVVGKQWNYPMGIGHFCLKCEQTLSEGLDIIEMPQFLSGQLRLELCSTISVAGGTSAAAEQPGAWSWPRHCSSQAWLGGPAVEWLHLTLTCTWLCTGLVCGSSLESCQSLTPALTWLGGVLVPGLRGLEYLPFFRW